MTVNGSSDLISKIAAVSNKSRLLLEGSCLSPAPITEEQKGRLMEQATEIGNLISKLANNLVKVTQAHLDDLKKDE
jgi:hypothetical protein